MIDSLPANVRKTQRHNSTNTNLHSPDNLNIPEEDDRQN